MSSQAIIDDDLFSLVSSAALLVSTVRFLCKLTDLDVPDVIDCLASSAGTDSKPDQSRESNQSADW